MLDRRKRIARVDMSVVMAHFVQSAEALPQARVPTIQDHLVAFFGPGIGLEFASDGMGHSFKTAAKPEVAQQVTYRSRLRLVHEVELPERMRICAGANDTQGIIEGEKLLLAHQLHPVVAPHELHFRQDPFRTIV